jgi:hypothetical protein
MSLDSHVVRFYQLYLPTLPQLEMLQHMVQHYVLRNEIFRTRILSQRAPALRIRIRDGNNSDPEFVIRKKTSSIISKNLVSILLLKIFNFYVAHPDPGSDGILTLGPGSGMEISGSGVKKFRIRDPG